MHDTAIQESGMLTLITALSIWLLLRASRVNRNLDWFAAGLALGCIALVRASPAPFIPLALVWITGWGAKGSRFERTSKALLALVAAAGVLSPWLIRTWRLTGSPVLSSQTGFQLWNGNNPETFSHYPFESIDLNDTDKPFTPAERLERDRQGGNEILVSNWYARHALAYMKANPRLIFQGAFRKIGAAFSWTLNPVREPLAQAAYFLGWAPVSLLGCAGILLAWPRRELIVLLLPIVSFICVTAVFFAHTSHRTYLDLYMIVLAASVLERLYFGFGQRTRPIA
jgi:4-amino-4-deoxy-L-arabinose transferase-like glycosyltransferase